jgi:hypothetical protein
MARIVPGIDSVEQHLKCLENDPEAYRPERCPCCEKAGLHRHGHYERKAHPGRVWPSCWRDCSFPLVSGETDQPRS